MRRISVAFIVLFFHCGVAAALEPTFKINVETPPRPVVNGQTNLPDGTELIISINRKETDYLAQDKVEVAGGKFTTQEFSEHGSDLSPGTYSVEVLMPVQSNESVLSIIGKDGEKLTGPLVKYTDLSPPGLSLGVFTNLVEYVLPFQVGERK
jgi:hypothetical protein